jgi:hypothetical protein
MFYTQKLNLLKKISLISLFFSIIPITFVILILREISVLNALLNDYIISGKSLFIPFLPSYNVFWFLPKEAQIIQFSTGHLIDTIIFTNIISIVEIAGYHYYKKTCLNEDFLGSDQEGSKQELYAISQDPSGFFGFMEDSSFSFDYNPLYNRDIRNLSFSEGLRDDFNQIKKQSNRINFFLNIHLLLRSLTIQSQNFQFFRIHPIFEDFDNYLSYYDLFYPQIKANINYSNFFQYRGINALNKTYKFKKFSSSIIKMNYIKKLNKTPK